MKFLPPKTTRHQQGFLIIVAVVLIVVVGGLIAALTSMFTASSRAAQHELASDKAYFIAMGGIERALYALRSPNLSATSGSEQRLTCGSINLTESLGEGQFQVVGTFYNPTPASLTSNITASDTIIPASTVTGFLVKYGVISIDLEVISYKATSTSDASCSPFSAPCFTGATRGYGGTVAASHSISPSAPDISQYLCSLQSTGAVPSLANPQGKRIIQAPGLDNSGTGSIIVGNSTGNSLTNIYSWNGATWARVTALNNNVPVVNYNGVFLVNNNDGWIVGNGGNILRLDGTQWFPFIQVDPNVTLQTITCTSANNCWAVGYTKNTYNSNADGRIYHYDGTSWTQTNSSSTFKNKALWSVYCLSTNDCWAAGTGGRFYHYTGSWSDTPGYTLGQDINTNIVCPSSSNCLAGGSSGALYRYNGGSWSACATLSATKDIYGLFCNSDTDCWASDTGGNVYHYSGGAICSSSSWTTGCSGSITSQTLRTIGCLSSSDCWAFDVSGGMYHYSGGACTAWSQWNAANNQNIKFNNLVLLNMSFLYGEAGAISYQRYEVSDYF